MISRITAEEIISRVRDIVESVRIKLSDNTVVSSSNISKSNVMINEQAKYAYISIAVSFNLEAHVGKRIVEWSLYDIHNRRLIWETANFVIETHILPAAFIVKAQYNE